MMIIVIVIVIVMMLILFVKNPRRKTVVRTAVDLSDHAVGRTTSTGLKVDRKFMVFF